MQINRKFSNEILKIDKLRSLITEKEYINIYTQLEKLTEDPQFIVCEATAHDLLASFFSNAEQLIEKQVKECYLMLTNNRNYASRNKFKTVTS